MTGTLPECYRPLMLAESISLPYCAVCGRTHPLEQHHIVWRSWGELHDGDGKIEKPTVTLCGFGNSLPYCHGLAHHRMLHFRFEHGSLEYLLTDEPTRYMKALGMDGWRPVMPASRGRTAPPTAVFRQEQIRF